MPARLQPMLVALVLLLLLPAEPAAETLRGFGPQRRNSTAFGARSVHAAGLARPTLSAPRAIGATLAFRLTATDKPGAAPSDTVPVTADPAGQNESRPSGAGAS